METKILKAVFGGSRYTVTNKRTRTDYGQVLEISGVDLPSTFECIFSNSSTSAGVGKKQIGSAQRVLIPDEYLATGQTIYAWILLHDSEGDGRHMYNIKIPVDDMPDTSPEDPTPVEQSVISQAISALNSAVDTTTQKAQEATESADRAEQAAEGVEGYAERAEAAQQAAESARDRATQAETSARTSAATASEKASEAISSATTASQSAITAENASESAQEYATASAESASQASQSADTASGKASDASEYASNANTSAQTASQKASEAAQSASSASQSKTDAETAKQASETAQGLAESARDEAVTAKEDAESARDEAQSIADGITGKVEQIDSNTDRIESLEDDRYKPYAVDTASGSIASFPDGADGIPLKSCIVRVEPVQDLHGYDHPWPAGGGVNLLPFDEVFEEGWTNTLNGITATYSKGIMRVTGTSTSTGWTNIVNFQSLWKSNPLLLGAGDYIMADNLTIAAAVDGGGFSNQFYAFTARESVSVAGFYIAVSAGRTVDWTIPMMFIHGTDKPTTYAPYENICPITGWTGVEVQRTGKNLLDVADDDNAKTTAASALLNSAFLGIKFEEGKQYTFSIYTQALEESTTAKVWYARFCYSDGTLDSYGKAEINNNATASGQVMTRYTNISKPGKTVIGIQFNQGTNYGISYKDVQIEVGSTATPYEPYTGRTYPITFPTEAGTVYGGYIDPINGELVVDRAQIASYNGETLPFTWISDRDVYASGTTPTIGAQVVYKLAEPIHYPLTPTEIRTLLGQNNIWADTGDTEVEYRADTKLYINKKIAEAISALS